MRTDQGQLCDVEQTQRAKLVFVRLHGELEHVATFRTRDHADRLSATCPSCESPVTVRLGDIRTPHAAHRRGTGEGCPAASGESALHLNSKIALGKALQKLADDARQAHRLPDLEIALACLGATDCRLPAWRPWPVTWDQVKIECQIGVHRPDIVLTLAGREVGALEVLVSHQVTPEKSAALRMLGVPWLEVSAAALGFKSVDAGLTWTHGRVLPVHRASKESAQWYCPRHEAARRVMEARQRLNDVRNRNDPAAADLVAYGNELVASEKEVAQMIAETDAIQRETEKEVARLDALARELPKQIADSRLLLERAKADFDAAQAQSTLRMDQKRNNLGRSVLLEGELREIDEELRHYERLRRRLSGYPEEGAIPGHFNQDVRRTLFWRPMDVYQEPTRDRPQRATRGIFHVDRVTVPGKADELVLMEDGNTQHCRVDATAEDAFLRLCGALESRIARRRASGALIDFPCPWVRVPPGESIPNEAWWEKSGPVPRAYSWDPSERRWVLSEVVDTPMLGV